MDFFYNKKTTLMHAAKGFLLLAAFVFTSLTVKAQTADVVEPDSTSAELFYVIPDGKTLQAIPYEVGLIKEHKNKFGDIASKVGKIADAAGILGSFGVIAGANIGSLNTALGGIKVMSTAGSVADVAEITNSLAGAEGHDFTYDGANAKTIVKKEGKDLQIIANLRCTSKEAALAALKVVRFKTTKKDRRLRWFQTKAALIGTSKSEEADKAGYLSFGYQNYGDHSTLLTIPASQLEPGEYGIYFLANMFEPNLAIRCYTFSLE